MRDEIAEHPTKLGVAPVHALLELLRQLHIVGLSMLINGRD
jgi:hypothetical protein